MKNKYYLYEIMYASGILRSNGHQNQVIVSNKKLKKEQFIVVEHIDCGVFIGKVVQRLEDDAYNAEYIEYRYLKNIDLKNWVKKIDAEKRYLELKEKMEIAIEKINKERKYEYYAEFDPEFKKIFDEYKKIESEINKDLGE